MAIYILPACGLLLIVSGGLICVPFSWPVFLAVCPDCVQLAEVPELVRLYLTFCKLVRICVLVAVTLFIIPFRLIYGLCTHI